MQEFTEQIKEFSQSCVAKTEEILGRPFSPSDIQELLQKLDLHVQMQKGMHPFLGEYQPKENNIILYQDNILRFDHMKPKEVDSLFDCVILHEIFHVIEEKFLGHTVDYLAQTHRMNFFKKWKHRKSSSEIAAHYYVCRMLSIDYPPPWIVDEQNRT